MRECFGKLSASLLIVFGLLCGASVVASESSSIESSRVDVAELEAVRLLKITRSELVLEVRSNGCTSAKNFDIKVKGDALALVRVEKDRCRKMPSWKRLDFTLSLSAQSIRLLNPLDLGE